MGMGRVCKRMSCEEPTIVWGIFAIVDIFWVMDLYLGLDRTGHMSLVTRQEQTPKFSGQVLLDQTESIHIFFNILPYKQTKKKTMKKIGKKNF